MDRVPTSPPRIKPLQNVVDRPRWSVMIPVYNCSNYLPETLESVLSQALPEHDMQIEVVDDASSDANVEEIVMRLGRGRVTYFRQPENVGSIRNFETCINRSRGELIHLLHGDDRIRNGFYVTMTDLFQKYPEAGAALCRFSYINHSGEEEYTQSAYMNHDGILQEWLLRLVESNLIQYAAFVVKREVYEKLGSFYGVTYGEDWEMWLRIARYYSVAYTPTLLAEYRIHFNSISGGKFADASNLKDILQVIDVIKEYLPDTEKEQLIKKSKKFWAHYGLHLANTIWHNTHNKRSVYLQIKLSLKMHSDISLFKKIGKIYIKILINKK